MKYSEYLQLITLLEEQGITMEAYEQNPQLYEGILGNVGKKVLNLLGKGMKALISKGVSQNHIQKLNQSANKIVQMVEDKLAGKKGEDGNDVEGVIQSIEKNVEKYKEGWKTKNKVADVPEELLTKLDNKKNKEIAKYINGQVEAQSDKVKNSIKTKKGVDDDDRENLMNYWQQLMTKINVDVSGKLIEKGILEYDDAYSVFKDMMSIGKKGMGTPAAPAKPTTAGTKPATPPKTPAKTGAKP